MPALLAEIRVTDVVDILLVSALVYAILVWLRRTRGTFVLIGILILGGIYAAASEFGLQLTAWIFQGFFAIFLILIVIIFQDEMKALLERLAVLSLGRGSRKGSDPRTVDTLVGVLADFARTRTGALIVLPGRNPVERHVSGGIELGARVSEPLLRSLFDTHSPGHDGAVIVENDRITRFAVHLPLSKAVEQLRGVGTRHSAALGLAEVTDALCLVVSEERGGISVASGGILKRLESAQEAGFLIQEFLRALRPARTRSWWRDAILRNPHEKLIALVASALLWVLFVPGSTTSSTTYRVPITVENLPPGLVVDEIKPATVRVTITGVRRAFLLFEPTRLEVVIDGSQARLGSRTYRLTEENLKLPPELSVEDIETLSIFVRYVRGGPP